MANYDYDKFQLDIINGILEREQKISFNSEAKDINEDVVENIMKKKYTNASDIDILKNIFNMALLIHKTSDYTTGIPHLKNSIVDILRHIRLASSHETSQGYALLSGFKTKDDLFILKTTRDSTDNSANFNTLYEYFIGTYGLNSLRTFIPNFCYTLGVFKCEPLTIEKKDKTIDKEMCKNKGDKYYVIYERIPGTSLFDYFKKKRFNLTTVMSYLMQICFSLQVAYEKIGFVHYDLHPGNIILRPLDHPIDIEYNIGGVTYRVHTDAIATIIDYGFSHFVYGGVQFGGQRFDNYDINPETTAGGFDMFKIFSYCMHGLHKSDIYSRVLEFYKYYTTDPYEIIKYSKKPRKLQSKFKYGYDYFFYLPRNDPFYYSQPIDFVKWMFSNHENFCKEFINVINKDNYVDSSRLIERYQSKLEERTIFNMSSMQSIKPCNIGKDYRSVIVNKYIVNNMEEFDEKFGNTVYETDMKLVRSAITKLDKDTESNRWKYLQNDRAMISYFKTELGKHFDKEILCETLNKNMRGWSMTRLKEYFPTIKIIAEYCKIYTLYKKLVYYSKWSDKIDITPEYQNRYFTFLNTYKNYYRQYSENIFRTISKCMSTRNITSQLSYDFQYAFNNMCIMKTIVSDELKQKIYTIFKDRMESSVEPLVWFPRTRKQVSRVKVERIKTLTSNYVDNPNVELYTSDDESFYSYILSHKKPHISTDKSGYITNDINRLLSGTSFLSKFNSNANFSYIDIEGGDGTVAQAIGAYLGRNKDDIVCSGNRIVKKYDNVTYVQTEGDILPFNDKRFSLVTMFKVLQHRENPETILKEAYRILSPGGFLVVKENKCITNEDKILCDIEHIINYRMFENNTPEENKKYTDNYIGFYKSSEDWRGIIESCGFSSVNIRNGLGENTTGVYYELFVKISH